MRSLPVPGNALLTRSTPSPYGDGAGDGVVAVSTDACANDAERSELLGAIKAYCAERLTDFIQYVWIKPLGPVLHITADVVVLVAPNHVRGWVRERYGDLLRVAASAALDRNVVVHLVDAGWSIEREEVTALEAEAEQLRRRRQTAARAIQRYGPGPWAS